MNRWGVVECKSGGPTRKMLTWCRCGVGPGIPQQPWVTCRTLEHSTQGEWVPLVLRHC